jgi:transcription-repair coupling factor (superfamily II helicase)
MTLDAIVTALAGSEPVERILLARERPIRVRAEAGEAALVAALATALDVPVLVVTPGPREAEARAAALAALLGEAETALLPAWEAVPYEGIAPAPEIAARRAAAIGRLRRARGRFVAVAPVLGAMQRIVPTLGTIEPIELAPGTALPPDELAGRLEALGYERVDVVSQRGVFAVRGGVVDVFPAGGARPVRLDYWGDEIESIRAFSPASQLSTERLERVVVGPARELVLDAELRARAGERAAALDGRYREGLERIAGGLVPEDVETLAPLLFDELPTPAELLVPGSWVVLDPAERTLDRAEQVAREARALAEAVGWPGPPLVEDLPVALGDRVQVHLGPLGGGVESGLTGWGSAEGDPVELAGRLRELLAQGVRVAVVGRGRGSLERAREVLNDVVDLPGIGTIEADLASGFVARAAGVAVATEEDLFGTRRHTREAPRFTHRRSDAIADELEPGDLAVHRVHGIGRYAGIVHREIGGAARDYLVLEYAQGDRLFVPSDQVGMVARYVGGDPPAIHRLGGSDWARATARVRRAVRDMAGELVRLYTVRMSIPGRAFGPDTPWQRELEDAFPHVETPDQLRVIDEVKRDMERPVPMDRLILGDVGFGKTEIALRAAFKAVMDGAQVAVLVPTTLLAEQHLRTFRERFAPFPVTVRMLSRFVPPTEQRAIVADLAAGRVDVVIGTHRLLGRDVSFANLGLVIVDEEQRFGVAHKERLKALRAQVDVLTMSATPIPRTLEMALSGIRQLSTIDTPPEDRQPVLTYVGSFDEALALGAVRRELLREGQVFWVHDRVATIDRRVAWLRERIPEARIAVAHGQMDEEVLEREMLRFWEREADLLVCTTIIESGLDVPHANTLVVDRADRLGLAQLYQLRGRVGRAGERAFAYLFFPPARRMTEEAHLRLETIARHQALGSGFRIALRDLEIRGAGNLLGAEQSGHIAAVGFDAYARILGETVAELRGEPVEPEREVRIELPVRAFIPPGWVAQEALRLELYRRISVAPDHDGLRAIRAEAADRYGALPPEVEALFAVASLRVTARRLGVEEISMFRDQVRLTPVDLDEQRLATLEERAPGASFHRARQTLNFASGRRSGAELVAWVEAALRAAVGEPAETGLAAEPVGLRAPSP